MTAAKSPLDGFIDSELARSPIKAARLGLPVSGPLVPDMSETAINAQKRDDEAWLDQLMRAQSATSSLDDAIDRELAISGLRGRAVLTDWQLWRRSPELYTTPILTATQLLLDHPNNDRADAVREAALVLAHAPDLIAQGRRNLDTDLAVPRLLHRAAIQARAAAAWCREVASFADFGDTEGRHTLEAARDTAVAAFEAFSSHLANMAESAHGSAAIGEDRYNALLKSNAGSGHDAASIQALGNSEIRVLRERITALRAEHPQLPAASQAAVSVAELFGWYETELRRTRAFCIEHSVLTLPQDEECVVPPRRPTGSRCCP